ncbi:hypothetical protein AURDEDRAFT_178301 [Auricularia subglabra TFB-10046 SS5]|uniref:Uncharacterized protein n=1 Tax=Auricularia subglabra (strain TFB-10046 / SS5) TaxID=717982 RepID=J0L8E4_AURST|nr:hypothetical protein AURDEDRAFT_178301 [Auricularia subglabra TFB-10046 SS5]
MRPLSEHAARRTRRVPIASVISVNLESAILEHTLVIPTSLEALPIARPPTPRLASPSTPASMARGSPDCPGTPPTRCSYPPPADSPRRYRRPSPHAGAWYVVHMPGGCSFPLTPSPSSPPTRERRPSSARDHEARAAAARCRWLYLTAAATTPASGKAVVGVLIRSPGQVEKLQE